MDYSERLKKLPPYIFVEIDKKKIHIEEPIKVLGNYTVQVKVAPEQTAQLKVEVVKKD
mgnify:CR=1 FL=1